MAATDGAGPGQGAAPVDENLLAERMIHPRLPVVGKEAVLPDDTLGYIFGQVGAEYLELVFLADALVPAAKQEAGIVDIVVEVVVGEEQVVNLGREQPRLHQLVGSGRAAVEHQELLAQPENVGTAKPGGCGRRCASAEGIDVCHIVAPVV